jgi:rRNA maturation RNase YbeY
MIEINNLTTNPIEEEFLKKVAKIILVGEKKEKANLSIALVGQGRIRALNKKYRGKNRVTDILAFPGNGLGEVVICLREVKKNAKRLGFSFEVELSGVLIHGILHLLGYNHEKSEIEAEKMKEKEEYYLLRLKT